MRFLLLLMQPGLKSNKFTYHSLRFKIFNLLSNLHSYFSRPFLIRLWALHETSSPYRIKFEWFHGSYEPVSGSHLHQEVELETYTCTKRLSSRFPLHIHVWQSPGRNQTLFRFVFRLHYCVLSALVWNFC